MAAGGLHIIGTERHESRRIDNQLRGRSGRQGDPGSSRFYLSLEDNLMRIFGDPTRTKALLSRVGMREGEVIESRMLTRQIERAQRKVEAHNFDARKNLLEYDDVANDQRKVIYAQRTELMAAADVADAVRGIREEVVNGIIDQYVPPESVAEQWKIPELAQAIEREFGVSLPLQKALDEDPTLTEKGLRDMILGAIVLALLVGACSTGGGSKPAIKVGSVGFDEARVMAEIYAQVLEANGYSVDRAGIGLGARPVVAPAIESGQIDLQPEYIGSRLAYEGGTSGPDSAANATALAGARDHRRLGPCVDRGHARHRERYRQHQQGL